MLTAYGAGGGASPAGIAERMVRIRTVVGPDGSGRFAEPYLRLLDELERRGWLRSDVAAYAQEHG
ncbi:MAG: carbohydrate kinase [Actinoallomurus sp.]|nr:carbohydrate kinase [Actinoallomurus sp.]